MEEELNKLIMVNDFEKAYSFLKKFSIKKQYDVLVSLACVSTDIRIIGFAEYTLQKEETYENHELLANILNQMCWLEGAYELAYFHALQMYQMKPCEESRLFLLFYWEIPEKPLADDFALKLVDEILCEEPENKTALYVYEELKAYNLYADKNHSIIIQNYINSLNLNSEEKYIHKLLIMGKFEKAYSILSELNSEKQFEMLSSIASASHDICIIGFAEYILQKKETYENHKLLANILNKMSRLEGAYELAYFHAKRMYEMSPCIESRLFLLFYWEIPEHPISDAIIDKENGDYRYDYVCIIQMSDAL